MRNKVLSSIVFFILGGLIAIGPYTIFPVCKAAMMPMRCQDTAKVEIVLGILTIAIGVLFLLLKNRKLRIWLNLAAIPIGVLALLFPSVIIGVCPNPHMSCRSLALPALSIISTSLIVFAAINAVYLWKFTNKGENFDAQDTNFK